ncbi:hypothetical protein AVEN_85229-1 [Araneus ventricosus]|uniref:Uncharacterized protein n=1 Tax=Araneus ventricosus TaxID=182803 RepID=A0A4Y2EED1_ARAVE|nr:hypothetical protein AVEN_85229-1 [Araneus ventricosus]
MTNWSPACLHFGIADNLHCRKCQATSEIKHSRFQLVNRTSLYKDQAKTQSFNLNQLWAYDINERPVGNTDSLYFVLDGGSLIQRVVCPKQETFGDVYTTYMSYIKRHYGDEVTVVFDGYTESSVNTKHDGTPPHTTSNVKAVPGGDILAANNRLWRLRIVAYTLILPDPNERFPVGLPETKVICDNSTNFSGPSTTYY